MDKLNTPRWIWASVTKHFAETLTSYPLHIEGHDRITSDQDKFEVRVDGPSIDQISKDYYRLDIEVNLLITSIKDEKDQHKLQRMIGIGTNAFTDVITVMKYGNGVSDDRTVVVGCLQLRTDGREKLFISNFGTIENTQNVLQATVEGHYRMEIS